MITADDLRAFAEDIAAEYNAGRIPHPVHLSDGNEDALIEAFKDIGPDDWVCGGWRFHSQCLLKGVPRGTLKTAIMRGHSIALNFPDHRVVCSAIVGGILPIATGIALGIHQRGGAERVHCWLGDMTARTGAFMEARDYARGHDLPIRWLIEDNGMSVKTPTVETWGRYDIRTTGPDVIRYPVSSKWPHSGTGTYVHW